MENLHVINLLEVSIFYLLMYFGLFLASNKMVLLILSHKAWFFSTTKHLQLGPLFITSANMLKTLCTC